MRLRGRAFGVAIGALALGLCWRSAALEDQQCFACHGDPTLTKEAPGGKVISLYVDKVTYDKSVHGSIGCVSCHTGITELPHPPETQAVNCGSCHDEAKIYAKSLHGRALARGDKDAAACQDCHGTHDILPKDNPLSRVNPRNQPKTCGVCHSNRALVRKHMVSIVDPSDAYLKSAHAKAIERGNFKAASCSSCHGSHLILPAMDPRSPVYRQNIAKTCGKCHPDEVKKYRESIHGRALAKGIPDAPTCIDCHGEHDIEPQSEKTSMINLQQVSRVTCPRCHDNQRIMKRYGVVTQRQASYMDSYHGMASTARDKVVASCTSCHGVHDILPASDPRSSINRANLPRTCGKCHKNAGPNFASAPVHVIPTAQGEKALGIIRLIYIWAIALILGSMALHNILLLGRHAVLKYRYQVTDPGAYRRFSTGQAIGHMILMASFITLAISGFALRYPNTWFDHLFFYDHGASDIRGEVHRVAGVVLIALTVGNVFYSIFWRRGRSELRALLIRWKDFKDLGQNLAFTVGLSKKRPQFDRYSYSEKFEYWGLWWGSVLMAVTGMCMWYANDFLRYFPKIFLDIADVIHFYEAWLAVGTIIVWHLYFMIADPESYPMNWTWLTRRITRTEFKERHGLEYERVTGEPASEVEPSETSLGEEWRGDADPK